MSGNTVVVRGGLNIVHGEQVVLLLLSGTWPDEKPARSQSGISPLEHTARMADTVVSLTGAR